MPNKRERVRYNNDQQGLESALSENGDGGVGRFSNERIAASNFPKGPGQTANFNNNEKKDIFLSEFNNEFADYGVTLENGDTTDQKKEGDTEQASLLLGAVTFVTLKIVDHLGNKFAPRIFEKIVKKLQSKMDKESQVNILGYGKISVVELVDKWRNVGRILWPKADWDSLDGATDIESINIFHYFDNIISKINEIKELTKEELSAIEMKVITTLTAKEKEQEGIVAGFELTDDDIKLLTYEGAVLNDVNFSSEENNFTYKVNELANRIVHLGTK